MSEEKTIKQLTKLLEKKDAKIKKLKAKNHELRQSLDGSRWGWAIPRKMEDDIEELPVPRLEIRCRKLLWDDGSWTGDVQWDYYLVCQHLVDGLKEIPLGRTTTSSSNTEWPRVFRGRLDLPYRDGCHIHHDAAHLDLPCFAVSGDRVENLNEASDDYMTQRSTGRKHRRGDRYVGAA